MTLEEATARLAIIPKPVACGASVSRGALNITCRAIGNPGELDEHRIAATRIRRSILKGLGRFCDVAETDPILNVRSHTESRVFSLSALSVWLRDYRLAYASLLHAPDVEARSSGACAILYLGPPIEMTMESGTGP